MEFENAGARVVVIAAPAGYGKTILAGQLAARCELAIACDCAPLESEQQFWFAMLAAIRSARVGRRHRSLELARATNPTFDNVLAALADLEAPIALVFENAERAMADASLRKALQRVVAASPRACTTIVCSRTRARMQMAKFAPPHELIVFGAADLAFDRSEIDEALDLEGGSEIAREVAQATSGWPVAVLFLQRFADPLALREALRRLNGAEHDALHEYLVDEVIGEFSEAESIAILCASAVPRTTLDDIARALGGVRTEETVSALLSACPFFQRGDDECYQLHSLLQSAIERRFPLERRRIARELAGSYEKERAFVRAAQIYRTVGDVDAMARALIAENANPDRTRTLAYSALLATLDEPILTRYPILRALTVYWRRFRVDPHALREESELAWTGLRTSGALELRANVGATIARIMYETGAFERAEALLRDLETEYGGIPEVPTTAGQAYVARTLGCIAARSGRFAEAERYFRSGYLARPGAESVRSRYFIERALIERILGHPAEERRLAALAIEAALASDTPVQAACALAEAAFGAWLGGDDDAAQEFLLRLERYEHTHGYIAFAHLCAIGSGIHESAPNGTEQPNWLACAHIIAAAGSTGAERRASARAAKTAADVSNDAFLRVLATITLAFAEPDRRDELLAEATALADAIEAPALHAALAAIVFERPETASLLEAFSRRFGASADPTEPVVRVEVLTQRVLRDGAALDVGAKGVALLVALGAERRAYSRAALAENLWPDSSEAGSREAINSCVYRIRSRLGPGVIVFENDTYRLGDGIRVDIRDVERWVAVAQRRGALTPNERTILEGLAERLSAVSETPSEAWEFLTPVLIRARQMCGIIFERLAGDALRAGDTERALEIARELIANDPCDETARDVAIRALLAQGQRSLALAELRDYQKVLWRELEVRPSAALAALLREDDVAVPT